MRFRRYMAACCAVTFVLSGAGPATAARDSSPLIPTGWTLAPAGAQFGVSQTARGFVGPLGAALSPDATNLLTASSGAARIDSADLFDLGSRRRADYVPYDGFLGQATFYGVAFSPDGSHAWVSGGGQDVVHTYNVMADHLQPGPDIPVPNFPAGLAFGHTPLGNRIYVSDNLSAPAANGLNPPGHQVTVIDPVTNKVTGTVDLGPSLEPLGVAFDHQGTKAYVTDWMGRAVSVIDTATQQRTKQVVLSPPHDPLQADHPGAIAANPKRDEVYTANANSDTVSVIDTKTDTLAATIGVSLVRGPKGAAPDGLTVSPDGRTLYVAEAGENAVAVVNLATRRVEGFIPAGWYPSSVSITPNGRHLVIVNDRGAGAGANPCGPLSPLQRTPACPPLDPTRDQVPKGKDGASDPQYTGSMIKATVEVLTVPSRAALNRMTRRVFVDNQVAARQAPEPAGARQIKHVIYIIKENRTYDQIFGSLGKGNGDPALNLFGDDSAPNTRALARRFTTLDNFYANAEVSADGHNWTDQANAPDYVEAGWPVNYSPAPRSGQRSYDFEETPPSELFATEPLASDPSIPRGPAAQTVGYLWDDAYAHGVSFRDYGESTPVPGFCSGGGNTSNTTHLDPRFGDHVDATYPGFNVKCSDHTQREPEWEREFRAFEKSGKLPSLEIVRLPNDHTAGTSPGSPTPQAMVADNDVALGRMVQVVSHSRYWRNTLIVLTEDDAQDGPDHVDAHRTEALAISPYTQTGRVDSTHYDTASLVATVEGVLGLSSMSIFDARAARLWRSFTDHPNFDAFNLLHPTVIPFGDPGSPVNMANSPMAQQSAHWNFSAEDLAPESALNRAIWESIRGRHSRMPVPNQAYTRGAGSSIG